MVKMYLSHGIDIQMEGDNVSKRLRQCLVLYTQHKKIFLRYQIFKGKFKC